MGKRRIVVCVGGSIAAYKACDLVSKLVQHEERPRVDVVMSTAAEQFVRPLSFAALTHRAVFTNDAWFANTHGGSPADHLRATEKADVLAVAPCTGNLIGKFAHGIADDIVSTTYLGADCPVLIAPAMNARMWAHPRVKANVEVSEVDRGAIRARRVYWTSGQFPVGPTLPVTGPDRRPAH